MVWGFDGDQFDKFVKCYTEGLPFFHIDHAYFKRGYEHGNFRMNFRHWHQTNVFYGLSADRTAPWRKRFMPWKTDGKKVVIVTPSPKICQMIGWQTGSHKHPKDWARQMEAEVKKHTDRPVYIKEKGEGFLGCIQDAWAVVSLSSVAEVEAVMFGVPVFVSHDSPARAVGLSLSQLDRIERPEYPDREDWFRTLSYSQYNKEEMASGKAWGILRELYGDHDIRAITNGGGELDAPQRPDEHHP